MSDPIGQNNFQEFVTAFLDGELEASQMTELVRYLCDNQDAIQFLKQQAQLMVAARRAIAKSPSAPQHLRQNIAQSAAIFSVDADRSTSRRSFWPQLAAAAAILIFIGGWAIGHHSLPDPAPHQQTLSVIPASLVAQASAIHADCSRLARGLHSAGFPKEANDLSDDVKQDLQSKEPYPDLASIGFKYEGAGPCAKPIQNTIHLFYRSLVPTSHATISLFVQVYHNQFQIEPGKLFDVSVSESPFPMLVWRTDHVIYFLLADDRETERKAIQLIGAAPKS